MRDDCLPILRNIIRGGGVAAAPSPAAPPSSEVFSNQMDDVITYMSTVITFEETCTDEYEDGEGKVKTVVCDRVNKLKMFSSIALSLANSLAKNGSSPWD